MIHLTKNPAPPILVQQATNWTAELIAAIAAGTKLSDARKRRYNSEDVKQALLLETHGKCAYCESKLRHITYGDIEHIIPKAVDPSRTYEWNNLTTACDVCNTEKSDGEGLVDPYADDPEQIHFRFMGPMVTVIPGSEPAKLSLAVLKLNRAELMEKRKERVQNLARQLEEIVATRDDATRRVLIKALIEHETAATTEYAACSRSFVRDKQRDGAIPAGHLIGENAAGK
jgi:uncharacterized protein (TIGR02646 family)